jgi:hypothetical protein
MNSIARWSILPVATGSAPSPVAKYKAFATEHQIKKHLIVYQFTVSLMVQDIKVRKAFTVKHKKASECK